ncbi:MAG TPA: hypothetical protein DD412_06425, partial [Holosporales bacterium]|nr:hypothetical protein [Holosporales bacterium]
PCPWKIKSRATIKKCTLINLQEAKQFSEYMAELFEGYETHIRLSVNKRHEDISQKLFVQMIFGSTVTPWHNTLFINSEKGILLAFRNSFEGGYLKEECYKGITIRWVSQSK